MGLSSETMYLGRFPFTGTFLLVSVVAISFRYHYRRIESLCIEFLSRILNIYCHYRYPIKNVAGTKDLPSLPYRFPNGTGDVEKFINGRENGKKWNREFGNIYRIWAGSEPEVVVSDPEHLKIIFHDSDTHIKATNSDSGWLMSEILGSCVGLLNASPWRKVRSKLEVPFTHASIQESSSVIRRETRRYMSWFRNMPSVKGGSFDPDKDLNFYPFLTTATLVYGYLDDETVDFLKQLAPLREELFKYVIRGGLARFWVAKFLPMLKFNRMLNEFQTRWTAFNERIYREKKSKEEDSPIIALWEMMIKGELPKVQLLQTLDESLFANLDVTSGAVGWNFVYLAANSQIQSELRNEIKQNLSTEGRQTMNELWDEYIARNNTFLAACIDESSRMRPFAYFSIPQAPPTDRKVGDWIIPKNTQIIVDAYTLNNRPEFWGDNTAVYDPSRFQKLDRFKTRYNLWRFGFGPRQCMGKHLADRMLRSIVSSIIWEYEIIVIPDDEEGIASDRVIDFKTNPDEWITKPKCRLGCISRGDRLEE